MLGNVAVEELVGVAMKDIPAEFADSRYRPEELPFPIELEWLLELGMCPHWLWLDVDLLKKELFVSLGRILICINVKSRITILLTRLRQK